MSFSGIAIYYMSPQWPYTVNTLLTLDSNSPVVLAMTSSNTEPIGAVGPNVITQVLWGQTGLSDTEHTLVISLAPGGRYIVVDALMYDMESILLHGCEYSLHNVAIRLPILPTRHKYCRRSRYRLNHLDRPPPSPPRHQHHRATTNPGHLLQLPFPLGRFSA